MAIYTLGRFMSHLLPVLWQSSAEIGSIYTADRAYLSAWLELPSYCAKSKYGDVHLLDLPLFGVRLIFNI